MKGRLHLIGGIPSPYTLFFYTSRRWYTLSHIPQVTPDGGRYNCYNTSGATSSSDISVVILIEVTPMSWKLNVIIRKQLMPWSLRSIRTQVWPGTIKQWQKRSTGRSDAPYISPIHMVWRSRPHGVETPHIHIPCLHSRYKPGQGGPVIRTGVKQLQSQGTVFPVLFLKQLCGGAEKRILVRRVGVDSGEVTFWPRK